MDRQERPYTLHELAPRAAPPWVVLPLAGVLVGGLWCLYRFAKLPPTVASYLEPSMLVIHGFALATAVGLFWEWGTIGRWKRAGRGGLALSDEELLQAETWPAKAYRNCTQRAAQELGALHPDSVRSVVQDLGWQLGDQIGGRWPLYVGLACATSLAGGVSYAWNLKELPEGVALAQGLRFCVAGIISCFACLLVVVYLSLSVRGTLREWQNHVVQLSDKLWKLAESQVPEPQPPVEVVRGRSAQGTGSVPVALGSQEGDDLPPLPPPDPFGFTSPGGAGGDRTAPRSPDSSSATPRPDTRPRDRSPNRPAVSNDPFDDL